MSNSVSYIGYGCDFQRSVDNTTWNTVGQIWEIGNIPTKTTTVIDHTNLASPGASKERRPGLKDPGDVTFKILYGKANYGVLFNDWSSRTYPLYWRLVFSDIVSTASTESNAGFVSKIAGELPQDDKILAEVTITFSGLPVFTAGS